jgi:hypothetical protein
MRSGGVCKYCEQKSRDNKKRRVARIGVVDVAPSPVTNLTLESLERLAGGGRRVTSESSLSLSGGTISLAPEPACGASQRAS